MTTAALYLRVSSDGQAADDRASLPVQEAACRALAERRGFAIVAMETDTESAYVNSASRQGYQRILTLARGGAIKHVVVYQFTRFGRDAAEALYRLKELKQLGVTLHSTMEDLTNSLLTGFLAVMAEDESKRISDRVRPAKRFKTAQGYFQGSRAPLGTVTEKGIA